MIGIIDYGMGNLGSVVNALEFLDIPNFVSSDPARLESAKGLILPGVGAAGEAMRNLRSRGLVSFIKDSVLEAKTPLLGICLGMQLLLDSSEEGDVNCLSIVPGKVKKFRGKHMRGLKVPQIGWNEITFRNSSEDTQVKTTSAKKSYFYFVHSYYCEVEDSSYIAGTTDYGIEFTSMIKHKNIWACQFHPEKSSEAGLQILRDFYIMTKNYEK